MLVKVTRNTGDLEDMIEVPIEPEGHMLLSILKTFFSDACNLKYKTEQSTWRGLRIVDGKISPDRGDVWREDIVYVVVKDKSAQPTAQVDVFDPVSNRTYNIRLDESRVVSINNLPFKFQGRGIKAKSRQTGKVQYNFHYFLEFLQFKKVMEVASFLIWVCSGMMTHSLIYQDHKVNAQLQCELSSGSSW